MISSSLVTTPASADQLSLGLFLGPALLVLAGAGAWFFGRGR